MCTLLDPPKDFTKAFAVVDLRHPFERRGLTHEVTKGSIHEQVDGIAETFVARAGRFEHIIGGAIESSGHIFAAVGVRHAPSWHAQAVTA